MFGFLVKRHFRLDLMAYWSQLSVFSRRMDIDGISNILRE